MRFDDKFDVADIFFGEAKSSQFAAWVDPAHGVDAILPSLNFQMINGDFSNRTPDTATILRRSGRPDLLIIRIKQRYNGAFLSSGPRGCDRRSPSARRIEIEDSAQQTTVNGVRIDGSE